MYLKHWYLRAGFLVVFFLGAAFFGICRAEAATVAVTGDIVNLRSGSGTGYSKIGEVSRGTQLTVVGQSGGWYRVRLGSGALAWIAGWLVKPVAVSSGSGTSRAGDLPSTQRTGGWVAVSGGYADLYSGPGTSCAKVGEASPGTQLAVIEQSGDWYKVRLQTGSEMWIAKSSTRPVSGAIPQVPVSRTRDEDGLIGFEARESGPVTEVTFTFVRPVDTQVSLSAVPPRLVVEIAGLPSGELGKGWDFDSGIVSRVYAEWVREEPPVARVVLDLKTSGAVSYQTLSSPDKRVLKLRLAAGLLYAVSGRVIVLDPGHGGSDPGALGPTGLQEKDFNLEVALLTAEELRRRGAQVFLTREADQYVDLYARTAKANSLGAAVFVSIHGNAAESPRLASLKAGTSTYWYAPADDPVLGFQRGKRELLARCLQKSLVDKLGRKDLGLFTANFVVLRTATMPAALVEVAFVSNPEEEGLMRADWFRQAAARALVEGLEDYFQQAG